MKTIKIYKSIENTDIELLQQDISLMIIQGWSSIGDITLNDKKGHNCKKYQLYSQEFFKDVFC